MANWNFSRWLQRRPMRNNYSFTQWLQITRHKPSSSSRQERSTCRASRWKRTRLTSSLLIHRSSLRGVTNAQAMAKYPFINMIVMAVYSAKLTGKSLLCRLILESMTQRGSGILIRKQSKSRLARCTSWTVKTPMTVCLSRLSSSHKLKLTCNSITTICSISRRMRAWLCSLGVRLATRRAPPTTTSVRSAPQAGTVSEFKKPVWSVKATPNTTKLIITTRQQSTRCAVRAMRSQKPSRTRCARLATKQGCQWTPSESSSSLL